MGPKPLNASCIVCHSDGIVAQQGFAREDRLETLEYMADQHGTTPIERPDFDRIADYLSAHYGPDRPNFPRSWRNEAPARLTCRAAEYPHFQAQDQEWRACPSRRPNPDKW